MKIGSTEHRKLLYLNIIRVAFKTNLIATLIGGALMLPSLLRENAFSATLQMLGQGLIAFGLIYSLWIAWKKHRAIKRSFAQFDES